MTWFAWVLRAPLPVAPTTAPTALHGTAAPMPAPERDYDIAAQALTGALAEFAAVSGINLLYRPGLAEGRRSRAVKGRYPAALALQKLLDGTGLQARFTSADAAILYASDAEAEAAPRAAGSMRVPALRLGMAEVRAPLLIGMRDPGAARRYAMLAQQKISALLYADTAYRGQHFGIELDIRVDAAGVIREARVHRSSGAARWDRQVVTTLDGQALPPPPPGLRQPMRFAIAAHPPMPQAGNPR